MFPDLSAFEVSEIGALPAALSGALDTEGPSVVSVECSADEIPPFAPFLAANKPAIQPSYQPIPEEQRLNVTASA
jgi:acetolactate synthase-1/2/3 large subunit